jgi:hypothetical protein
MGFGSYQKEGRVSGHWKIIEGKTLTYTCENVCNFDQYESDD